MGTIQAVVAQVVLQQQQRAAVAERDLHPEDAGLARHHPARPQHAERRRHRRPQRLQLQLGRQPSGVQPGKVVTANIPSSPCLVPMIVTVKRVSCYACTVHERHVHGGAIGLGNRRTCCMACMRLSSDALLWPVMCSGGSDWEVIKVLSINNDTGAVTYLNDTLNNVKFSSTAWSPDNKVPTPRMLRHQYTP